MKKISTLLVIIFIAVGMNISAQILSPVHSVSAGKQNAVSLLSKPHTIDQSASTQSLWVLYSDVADSVSGGLTAYWYQYLFPDSNVLECSTGCYYPWVASIGNVLDPYSTAIQNFYHYNWTSATPYTIDSMAIGYLYQRHISGSLAADTLIVTLYNDSNPNNLLTYEFLNNAWAANFGVDTLQDTLQWRQMFYNYHTNTAAAIPTQTFKVLLTTSDTTFPNYKFKYFNTSAFSIPAGGLAAASISFKPGYSYAPGDTITLKKNNFMFISSERNGAGTFPTYLAHDWNVSEIARSYERYNEVNNSWDSLYLPTWAFQKAYGTEDHLIAYKISSLITGLKENNLQTSGIKLYQNFPNPAANSTLLRYEISNPGSVDIEISDVAGRKLSTINQGMQPAGRHQVAVDLAAFSNGMYFYTLKTGVSAITGVMVVNK